MGNYRTSAPRVSMGETPDRGFAESVIGKGLQRGHGQPASSSLPLGASPKETPLSLVRFRLHRPHKRVTTTRFRASGGSLIATTRG
jgi:hypothetical protein